MAAFLLRIIILLTLVDAGVFPLAGRGHWYQGTSPAPMIRSPTCGTHVSLICFHTPFSHYPIRARRVSYLASSEHLRSRDEHFSPLTPRGLALSCSNCNSNFALGIGEAMSHENMMDERRQESSHS